MRNFTTIALLLLTMTACKQKPQQQTTDPTTLEPQQEVVATSTAEAAEEAEEVGPFENLNQIRFKDWTDEDWLDNDYFRTIRQHIDAWKSGKIKSEELDQYKDKIKGQFIIFSAEEFIAGGLWVHIAFIENPQYLFDVWVYSDVNEQTKEIDGYSIRGWKQNEKTIDITKEQILSILKEHPENKLW